MLETHNIATELRNLLHTFRIRVRQFNGPSFYWAQRYLPQIILGIYPLVNWACTPTQIPPFGVQEKTEFILQAKKDNWVTKTMIIE